MLWARSMRREVLPYPAGAERSKSLLSSNDCILSSKRGRESNSGRRLGTMILVLLIGIGLLGIGNQMIMLLFYCFTARFHLTFVITWDEIRDQFTPSGRLCAIQLFQHASVDARCGGNHRLRRRNIVIFSLHIGHAGASFFRN